MVLVDRSGVDLGPGIVTLALGVALAMAGLDAIRRGGWSPVWALAVTMALAAIVVTVLFVGRTYVFAVTLMYGPGTGIYLVVLGAVVAAIAGFRLRGASHIEREPA